MADLYRYRYARERADGKKNETTSRKTFEGWLSKYEPGDRFFVAHCRWGECEPDVSRVADKLTHVRLLQEIEGKDNG